MYKIITSLFLMVFTSILFVAAMVFSSMINAVILYFAWNFIAPIYFTTIVQPQFLHVPFLHCWVFLYIIGVIFGAKRSSGRNQEIITKEK